MEGQLREEDEGDGRWTEARSKEVVRSSKKS